MTKTSKPKRPKAGPTRTVDIEPSPTHARKPSELIKIRAHEGLSLVARRAITILWHNAHQQGIEPHKKYSIAISKLMSGGHKNRKGLAEAIESLMDTKVSVAIPNGDPWRTRLLVGHDLNEAGQKYGQLNYRFDPDLARVLEASMVWGSINIDTLMKLPSKYAISLYEHIALWVGLAGKRSELFTIAELRELLGVEDGNYDEFAVLNRNIVKRAVADINRYASFTVCAEPRKTGKAVTHIHLSWAPKVTLELQAIPSEACDSSLG